MMTDKEYKRRQKSERDRLARELYACEVAADRFSGEPKLQRVMKGLAADIRREIRIRFE